MGESPRCIRLMRLSRLVTSLRGGCAVPGWYIPELLCEPLSMATIGNHARSPEMRLSLNFAEESLYFLIIEVSRRFDHY
jgi:hypothetical protein